MKLKYFNSVSSDEKPCFDISEDLGGGNFGYIGEVFEEANAAFIVKAVNEYYPMQKIIKALVEKLDDDVWALELSGHEIACVQSIKEVLKEAE